MAKRTYIDYRDREDYKAGFYGTEVKLPQIEKAKDVLLSPYNAMLRVINKWPLSSKHNLSNANSNRRSWLGQAACCIECGCTEFETRMAWKELNKAEQFAANQAADLVIKEWEIKNNFNKNDYIKEDFTL